VTEVEDAAKGALDAAAETAGRAERDARLNSLVAALVALTATFMAVGNIKDGNVVQAMTQSQARAVDSWSYYQAKSTKQHIAGNEASGLRLRIAVDPSLAAPGRKLLEEAAARYEADARRYGTEKDEIRAKAEGFEKEYERLNVHDDQFDAAEACLTIAIAMYGISALTKKWWLFFFGLGLTLVGVAFTVSGFAGGNLHPDWLARFLG
jgi:hypothetical protein